VNLKDLILAFAVVVYCLFGGPIITAQDSSELHILASNLSRPAISELIPMFEKIYKIKVKVQYANNPILKQQIESGVKFDAVIIEPQMLAELAKAGFVDKNSIADLAKAGMALVSKEGSPHVDIGSVESFKKVLLSARSIAYTADGHSGAVFLRTLEQLGLRDEMKPKLVPVVGRLSTLDVAQGRAEYTAFPGVGIGPGLRIAGMFPEEIQTYIGISGGVSPHAVEPASARRLLEYLQSDSARVLFQSQGYRLLALTQAAVPIEKEPMHRLKFENEFVRLFDVLVPVGRTTQYHVHLYDGVSVRLSNTQIADESIAGKRELIDVTYAEATFGARSSPLTHRVVNTGKNDFRNIFIEILPQQECDCRPSVSNPFGRPHDPDR